MQYAFVLSETLPWCALLSFALSSRGPWIQGVCLPGETGLRSNGTESWLLPSDTAAVTASDARCASAFNDGTCEAQFAALRGWSTISGR